MAARPISGKEILNLLQQGYVRYIKDKEADSPGCIQETLDLTAAELKGFLQHPRLRNFKYRAPRVELVDDFGPELIDDFDVDDVVTATASINNEATTSPTVEAPKTVVAAAPAEVTSLESNGVENMLNNLMEDSDHIEVEAFNMNNL